jgi:hypothetical protein
MVIKSSIASCPKCGRGAEILDGDYAVVGDAMQIALSPLVSQAARAELVRLILGVQENRIGLQEAKQQIERIEPKLGKIFDIASWSGEAKATFLGTVLLSVATLVGAAANFYAPRFAPPAIIQVVEPQASPESGSMRKHLLGGTLIPPIIGRATSPQPEHNEGHNADRDARAKTGSVARRRC